MRKPRTMDYPIEFKIDWKLNNTEDLHVTQIQGNSLMRLRITQKLITLPTNDTIPKAFRGQNARVITLVDIPIKLPSSTTKLLVGGDVIPKNVFINKGAFVESNMAKGLIANASGVYSDVDPIKQPNSFHPTGEMITGTGSVDATRNRNPIIGKPGLAIEFSDGLTPTMHYLEFTYKKFVGEGDLFISLFYDVINHTQMEIGLIIACSGGLNGSITNGRLLLDNRVRDIIDGYNYTHYQEEVNNEFQMNVSAVDTGDYFLQVLLHTRADFNVSITGNITVVGVTDDGVMFLGKGIGATADDVIYEIRHDQGHGFKVTNHTAQVFNKEMVRFTGKVYVLNNYLLQKDYLKTTDILVQNIIAAQVNATTIAEFDKLSCIIMSFNVRNGVKV